VNNIEFVVNGKSFTGWESVEVRKSITNLSGSFSLSVSDKYPGKMRHWGFSMGDECEIRVGTKSVIKGYIEDIDISYDDSNHSIMIAGRDKLADIVDCSFGYNTTTWENTALQVIIKQLANLHGIKINIDSIVSSDSAAIVPKFIASSADDVMGLISQLCMHKAIIPCSYGDNKLTLTRSGGNIICTDHIELGYNVLSGGLQMSDKDRFSKYIVIGQGANSEEKEVRDYVEPFGIATDSIMSRTNRRIVIVSDKITDTGECIKQAKWESAIRAGNSRVYKYKVPGWGQANNGIIWPLNSKVKVKDNFLLHDPTTLLISELNFSMNITAGTTTSMTLVHPDTYLLLDQPIQIKTDFDYDY